MAKRKRKNPAETIASEVAKGAVRKLRKPRARRAVRPAAPPRRRAPARRAAPARRRRRVVSPMRSNPRSNPPLGEDLVEHVVPGFAGYGGTRLLSRIIYSVIIKRKPSLAKHAAVVAALASATAAWFLVHRWKKIERYHTPIVVGSAIAAIQTLVQTYLGKYGWIVSDYASQDALVAAPVVAPTPSGLAGGSTRIPRTVTVGGRRYALPPSPGGAAQDYSGPSQPQQGVGADALSDIATPDGAAQEDLGVLGGGGMFAGDDADIDAMIEEAANHAVN